MNNRYLPSDLKKDVVRYNRYLAESGTSWFFVMQGRNGYQAIDIHYVTETGRTVCQTMLVGGSSRECLNRIMSEYSAIYGELKHGLKHTRAMAKTVLSRDIDFNDDFHLLNFENTDHLNKWARLTNYRKPKNANGSLGRYFFQHLAKKVKV